MTFIKRIYRRLRAKEERAMLTIDLSASCIIDPSVDKSFINGFVGKNSKVIIEHGVKINGPITIRVQDNAMLIFRKNSIVNTATITVANEAQIELKEQAVLNPQAPWKQPIVCQRKGSIIIEEKAMVAAQLIADYGGVLRIGKSASIGPFTQIRAQEKVDIGSYVLISYHVQIFDTNTHSLNHEERRRSIDRGYPIGALEVEKSATAPVIIENDVWIGSYVNVAKGAVIGARSIIGMGTNIGKMTIPADAKVVSPGCRVLTKK